MTDARRAPVAAVSGPLPTLRAIVQILVLCTANVCRSPAAAELLAARLAARGVDADVRSAGRLSGGRPTTMENIQVMRRYGIELSEHCSQEATPTMIRGADLVVAMAAEHVADAVALAPDAAERTFTLRELVRLADQVGSRPDGLPLSTWIQRLDAERTPGPDDGHDDDIPDPVGGPVGRYEAVAAELADLTRRLVDLAWPSGVA